MTTKLLTWELPDYTARIELKTAIWCFRRMMKTKEDKPERVLHYFGKCIHHITVYNETISAYSLKGEISDYQMYKLVSLSCSLNAKAICCCKNKISKG